jgi:hypothetical protein
MAVLKIAATNSSFCHSILKCSVINCGKVLKNFVFVISWGGRGHNLLLPGLCASNRTLLLFLSLLVRANEPFQFEFHRNNNIRRVKRYISVQWTYFPNAAITVVDTQWH